MDDRQPTTKRFPQLPQRPTQVVIPTERPVCADHSGVCVRVEHTEKDVEALKGEIARLRLLPWKVVGAALGAGASLAAIIEALRALIGAAGG